MKLFNDEPQNRKTEEDAKKFIEKLENTMNGKNSEKET